MGCGKRLVRLEMPVSLQPTETQGMAASPAPPAPPVTLGPRRHGRWAQGKRIPA
ncbi:hypothetical protein Esi_0335_0002 [Ectocarpus siliculosus]|uniref:Uncharacterized protein n=1 Tax=Ectocarpus siliculosus TaxID=2880 RepID=D7FXX8_ECTSI|nr:hypothetical protein Esi_0335_0002 [Ectocarpus siliculosus]|eukprot:CBJ32391.1 hypothetical protein Esi_0335_0002 [Ectocarpus siliculosus]